MTSHDPTTLAATLDATTALFGVPMRPEWRDPALANLATIAAAARFVTDFALDDDADYAPVFQP